MDDLKKNRHPDGRLKFYTREDQKGEKIYDKYGRLKGFTDGKDTFDKSGRRVCLGSQAAMLFETDKNDNPYL